MARSGWTIKSTKISALKAPLLQPFRTALGDHTSLDNLLFTLKLSDGNAGYGEAAIATHITGETIEQTARKLRTVGQSLQGKDIREYLAISNLLHEKLIDNPAALAAIETALLDALTKRMNIPLWKFFGVKPVALSTDITIVIADVAETESTARYYYGQGFRQFKVKIGRDMDMDCQRLMAIKKVAPKVDIYLDANQGYNATQTLKFLKMISKKGIRPVLLEQPVPRADREGLIKISRSTKIPVCADESARSLAEVISLIKDKAVPVINIKLMKFGMIHAREVALLARSHGVDLMMGGMMESSVAMTAAAHLAAGMGCFKYIDLDTPFFIKDEVRRHPYLSSKGRYHLASVKRGIGITPR